MPEPVHYKGDDENNYSFKYEFADALFKNGGPTIVCNDSDPLVLAKGNQAVSAAAVMKALQAIGIETVVWVRIGAKIEIHDILGLDRYLERTTAYLESKEAHTPRDEGDPRKYQLRNQFDVGIECRSVEGVDRRVYFVASQPLNFCSGPNPSSCRTFPLAPGLFPFPCGSIQTQGIVHDMPEVEKLTIYNGPQRHFAQSLGARLHSLGMTVGNFRTRFKEIDSTLQWFVDGPKSWLELWCGIRVESRFRVGTTRMAWNLASTYGLLTPHGALKALGQYMLMPQRPQGQPQLSEAARTRFPLFWATPEVVLHHALRVRDAAQQVLVGRDSRKLSRRQLRAQVDLFACFGTTVAKFRATTPQDIAEGRHWWVVEVEMNCVPAADRASEESSGGSSDDSDSTDDDDDDDDDDGEEKQQFSVHEVPAEVRSEMMANVKFRKAIGRSDKVTWTQSKPRVCEETGDTVMKGPRNPCDSKEEVCDRIWATYGPEWEEYVTLN